jgi:hypothetical protein
MMKNIVRIGFLVLVLMLSISGVFADLVDNQATALFDLGILRGDGTGFKLEQTLTRAEALAFISRIKGDEGNLTALYSSANETKFKDNVKDQWYTRYINYGVSTGLVNGYSDGTFKPKAELTDKAFIKLLLVALGYQYDVDFKWDTVYSFAIEKTLITEAPLNEAPILRGDVVKLIYRALQLQVK